MDVRPVMPPVLQDKQGQLWAHLNEIVQAMPADRPHNQRIIDELTSLQRQLSKHTSA